MNTKKTRKRSPQHEEPSAESLREIPPLDPSAISFGRGSEGLARAREYTRLMRAARRRKGNAAVALTERSVRLPEAMWAEVERVAKRRFKSPDGIVRTAIVQWVLDARARKKARTTSGKA